MAETGIEIYEIDSYEVASWSPGDVTKGDPTTQVHVIIHIKGIKYPLVMRLKSKRAVDELVGLLTEYRDEVWPEGK
jgi:hypothetical protein